MYSGKTPVGWTLPSLGIIAPVGFALLLYDLFGVCCPNSAIQIKLSHAFVTSPIIVDGRNAGERISLRWCQFGGKPQTACGTGTAVQQQSSAESMALRASNT